jgi:uncharacterized membrane protein YgcG
MNTKSITSIVVAVIAAAVVAIVSSNAIVIPVLAQSTGGNSNKTSMAHNIYETVKSCLSDVKKSGVVTVEQIKYCMNIQDGSSGSGDGSSGSGDGSTGSGDGSTGSSDNNNPDTNSPGN